MGGGSAGLKRELGSKDVYAISTGAMFSSGFFLLPGIAFAEAGAWVVVAYVASAIIVLPAMFSKAELASSLAKSGGTYYFLDRAMGPLVGTIGGLGTWVAMGLKNTFALVGCGAYAALFFDVDMTLVALVFAAAFVLVNIVGAKETAALQRWFVYVLIGVLTFFLIAGFSHLLGDDAIRTPSEVFGAAPSGGFESILTTIAMVFVSYAGLTKVVGVAEEIDRPDKTLLRGMGLSLLTAATIYGAGTFIVVMVVDHATLGGDLTPIATAAAQVFDWMPGRLGVALIFAAALAAFLSTANAGILSASRYLLAMGRDRLISERFADVGRFRTPTTAVLATGLFIVVALLTLDVVSIAKLASAFQLLMFAFVSLAVIVMRESQIKSYAPTVKSPLYPWMQIAGVFLPAFLIFELGLLSVLFTLGIVVGATCWYFAYAKARVDRRGAILHWFERLGRERSETLAHEIWSIMKESGLSDSDPYLDAIDRAPFLDLDHPEDFDALAADVAVRLAGRVGLDAKDIEKRFIEGVEAGLVPVTYQLALPHFRVPGLKRHEMCVVRARQGVTVRKRSSDEPDGDAVVVKTLFFLISPERLPGEHLRILARLASKVDDAEFPALWESQTGPEELRNLLLAESVTEVADQVNTAHGMVTVPTAGDFENFLCVDQPGVPPESTVALVSSLAADYEARVTVVRSLPDLSAKDAELLTVARAELTTQLVEPLRAKGIDCDGKIIPGRPWTGIITEGARGEHDLVLVSAAPEDGGGFDSATRHLLRKSPLPVWVERAEAFAGHRRILAAVDASSTDGERDDLNVQVLRVARAAARATGATLDVVQAWHLPGQALLGARGVAGDELDFLRERERERVYRQLWSFLNAPDLDDAHVHLVEGDAATVVVQVAAEQEIDLVVMGTLGRQGIVGRFIGSTAEDVLRQLHCAVVAIKPEGFRSPIKP